jgi:hypothetical protein
VKDYSNNDKKIEKNVREIARNAATQGKTDDKIAEKTLREIVKNDVIREKTAVRITKKMSKKIVKAVRAQDIIEGKGVAKMRKTNVRNGLITGVDKTKVILAVGREVEIVVDC